MPSLDTTLLRALSALRTPALDSAMRLASSRVLLLALAAVAALWLWRRWRLRSAVALVVAMGISELLGAAVLKPLVDRPRPCRTGAVTAVGGVCPGAGSMPSDHAALGAAATVVLARTAGAAAAPVAGVIALLIGFSRLYLGEHNPSDVLAGYALGALVAWGVTTALRART